MTEKPEVLEVDDNTDIKRKKIIIFKIGDNTRPATDGDIKSFAESLSTALKSPSPVIVCYHCVSAMTVVVEDEIEAISV